MTQDTSNELLRDLMPVGVELRETHISWVLLARDRVLKLKKPVDFGFLDFSTLDRRRQACDAEVALNQRLAPGVYVGVVPISRAPGAPHRVGEPNPSTKPRADEAVVEWGVLMRRLPDADRGDVRLGEGRLTWQHLAALAETLARFHAQARTSPAFDRYGEVTAIAENVRQNFNQAHAALRLSSPSPNRPKSKRGSYAFSKRTPKASNGVSRLARSVTATETCGSSTSISTAEDRRS